MGAQGGKWNTGNRKQKRRTATRDEHETAGSRQEADGTSKTTGKRKQRATAKHGDREETACEQSVARRRCRGREQHEARRARRDEFTGKQKALEDSVEVVGRGAEKGFRGWKWRQRWLQ